MLKKSLIGITMTAIICVWYMGYTLYYAQYHYYQKQEQARLHEERKKKIAEKYNKFKIDAVKNRDDTTLFYKERRKRIIDGTADVEFIEGKNKIGGTYQYTLVDGKREGKASEWYKSGRLLLEINYRDHLINGEYTRYYDNSSNQLHYRNFYLNDKQEGEQVSWYKSGRLKSKAYFSQTNPELNNGIAWYESGIKKRESKFDQETNQFIVQEWYENKQLKTEYKKNRRNQLDGPITYWYESGRIKSKQEYKNGKHVGICTFWSEDGSHVEEYSDYYSFSVLDDEKFSECK